MRQPAHPYALSALFCALLVALPFVAVTTPPIADLPQQTAQARLLLETLAGQDEATYRVQWGHPNKLAYALLVVSWQLTADPLAVGRRAMVGLAWLWVVAAHAVAWRWQRSVAAAALASLLFFNHLTYWGFLSFLIGLPVFCLWLWIADRLPRNEAPGARHGLGLLTVAFALYLAHVLWLACGLVWLALASLVAKSRPQALLGRLVWLSPVLATVAAWYPSLARGGFDSATEWGRTPLERLHPEWLLNAAFGGLHGWLESAVAAALALWIGLGIWQHRQRLRQQIDLRLLQLAGLLLLAALLLPGVRQHTIFFASRWLPMAAFFAILACPAPRLAKPLRATPWALLTVFVLTTSHTWSAFERHELAGLDAALAALPEEPRLLGLDLVRTSDRIRGFPFYHLYAYAQVLKGGELNRSFANEASSLVVYRDLPRQLPWTDGLDWNARRLRRSDIEHFQFVLVNGREDAQAFFARDERLTAVTTGELWRLYRVD